MAGFALPGYDVVVNEAKIVPEGPLPPGPFGAGYAGLIPEHCRIDGEIDKRVGRDGKPYAIGFAVAMPTRSGTAASCFRAEAGSTARCRIPWGSRAPEHLHWRAVSPS